MSKRKHRFPESTCGVTLPGVGITLTRANIRDVNERREDNGSPLLKTPRQIVLAFCHEGIVYENKERGILSKRHLHRVEMILE